MLQEMSEDTSLASETQSLATSTSQSVECPKDIKVHINSKVFQLSCQKVTEVTEDHKVFSKSNLNKVNTIIDESEIDEETNELVSFNPTLLAQNWLTMGYGTIVLKSRSKSYLFKLLEFNKIEI